MNNSLFCFVVNRWMRRIAITVVAIAVVIGLGFNSAPHAQAGGAYNSYGFSWDCPSCTTGHGSVAWYSGDCGGCIGGVADPVDTMDTSGSPLTSLGYSSVSLNDGGGVTLDGGTIYQASGATRENCNNTSVSYGSPGGVGATTIVVGMHIVDECGGGYGGNVSFYATRIGPPAWQSSNSLVAPTAACATLQQEQSLGLPIVTLTWSGASAATRYDVYQNGAYAGSTTSTTFSLSDQSNTTYNYFIRAWNTTNYTDSNTVSFKTSQCGTTTESITPNPGVVPAGSTTPVPFTVNAKVDSTSLLP